MLFLRINGHDNEKPRALVLSDWRIKSSPSLSFFIKVTAISADGCRTFFNLLTFLGHQPALASHQPLDLPASQRVHSHHTPNERMSTLRRSVLLRTFSIVAVRIPCSCTARRTLYYIYASGLSLWRPYRGNEACVLASSWCVSKFLASATSDDVLE
jgi:hypothetical protein